MSDTESSARTAGAARAVAESHNGVEPSRASATRLHGRQLALARVAWAVAAAVLVGLYIVLLPACLAQLATMCRQGPCALVQPGEVSAQALGQLGMSVSGYAALTFGLILFSSLFCFVVSGVIVWRRSDDWMALLVALSQVALGTELVPFLLLTGQSGLQLPALVMNALDFAVLFMVFTLAPTGRVVPRGALWIVAAWLTACGALVVTYVVTGEVLFTVYTLIWLVVFSGIAWTQVYRYRFVSRARERAQTRWVVFGGVIALAIVIADFAPTYAFPGLRQPGSFYLLVSAPIYTLPIILFSICLAVALLRHRLYDIDVIIHLTLVYAVVTGTLAFVYALCVFVLQAGFRALTGQGTTLAIVTSTLAIAALFQPVRSRAQAAIDRRFYRRRHDAARSIATFSGTLRSEVDLGQLSERLLGVVQETMQPAHLSLWLSLVRGTGERDLSGERVREEV